MIQLLWIIVVVSSAWVWFDAKSIGVEKGQITGLGNMGPVGWGLACLLLWIVGFPIYLFKRIEYKRINGKTGSSALAVVVGAVLVLVQIVVCIMLFTGDIKMPESDLRVAVQKNIEETLAKDPKLAGNKVQSFELTHKTGDQYVGLLEVSADGKMENVVVDVTYDGKQFNWKVRK